MSAIEERLLEMCADPALDEKPRLLEERGGAYCSEAAVDLVAPLSADRGDVQVVNVRNGDRLPFLPAEEVPARIAAAGTDPLPVDPAEPLHAGLIAHVTGYEEPALEAARKGGLKQVADALLAHPPIGRASTAAALADRLVAANAAHLTWAVGA